MDLEGIVGGERYREAPGEVGREGVAMVVQEEVVIGERAHAQTNLQAGLLTLSNN